MAGPIDNLLAQSGWEGLLGSPIGVLRVARSAFRGRPDQRFAGGPIGISLVARSAFRW
jgi:hypothetical protein